MRIAVDCRVIDDHFPGIGRYAYRLVTALAEGTARDEIVAVVRTDQLSSRHDLAHLARLPGVRPLALGGGLLDPAGQWALRCALRGASPDVFHATYGPAALLAPGPVVLSIYDLIGRRVPGAVPRGRRLAAEAMTRVALARSVLVVTLSEWSRDDIVAWSGIRQDRVVVTPLAADPAFRPPSPAAIADLRRRLDLPPRYVAYVGIDKPHKNLGVLVDAWELIANARPDLVGPPDGAALVLAGPWRRRDAGLERRLAAAPAGTVRVIGPVAESDLPTLYGGAAAFAFPSRYEGFGLPPLEAMACGTPVVVSSATSLPEVVGDAGLLVDPDDVEGWSAALASLLSDAGLARRLSERALARAARFSWEATARRTRAAYLAGCGRGASEV